jgi:hypothetical protein
MNVHDGAHTCYGTAIHVPIPCIRFSRYKHRSFDVRYSFGGYHKFITRLIRDQFWQFNCGDFLQGKQSPTFHMRSCLFHSTVDEEHSTKRPRRHMVSTLS